MWELHASRYPRDSDWLSFDSVRGVVVFLEEAYYFQKAWMRIVWLLYYATCHSRSRCTSDKVHRDAKGDQSSSYVIWKYTSASWVSRAPNFSHLLVHSVLWYSTFAIYQTCTQDSCWLTIFHPDWVCVTAMKLCDSDTVRLIASPLGAAILQLHIAHHHSSVSYWQWLYQTEPSYRT